MVSGTPTARDIAAHLSAELVGDDRPITGLSPLSEPSSGSLTFVSDAAKYEDALVAAALVGAVILFPQDAELPDIADSAFIRVRNPRGAFATAVDAFFKPAVTAGIAPTAIVDATASVASSAHIGDYSVLGAGVVVGPFVEIRNHVVLAANVQIGEGSVIKSHAVIGEEGFGIDKDADGNNLRLPHLGSVVLGDHVEVGNFTTICSGTISATTVGDYTKIDDHVHVSHNVRIGRNAIITACAEISGSVQIGDGVWIGPNASIIQGLTIGANALIGIGAVVTKSVPASEVQFGNPARRIRDND